MSFFDKKEEVLNTELTSYGKKLLSIGKLIPVYYAFYDDDVLYDANYANFSESHSQTKGRIKDGITSKPVYTFASKALNSPQDKLYLDNELGNSSIITQFAPAWNIKMANNQFVSCSMTPPQAEVHLTYSSLVRHKDEQEQNVETLYKTFVYEDDYYMEIKRNYVLIDVSEINGFEESDINNFELQFSIINADGTEEQITFEESKKYLDVLTDNEIETKYLCGKVSDNGSLYTNIIEGCGNYNGELIFGKDNPDRNIYSNLNPDRGELCEDININD